MCMRARARVRACVPNVLKKVIEAGSQHWGLCIPVNHVNVGTVSIWDVNEPLRTTSTQAVTSLVSQCNRANCCKQLETVKVRNIEKIHNTMIQKHESIALRWYSHIKPATILLRLNFPNLQTRNRRQRTTPTHHPSHANHRYLGLDHRLNIHVAPRKSGELWSNSTWYHGP